KYTTPKEAEAHGISFIHQEPIYFYSMTVAQNIYLSRLFKGVLPFFTSDKKANEATEKLLKQLGADINPRARMEDISIGERQVVEIARALAAGFEIVIFDEPTSSLSLNEKENLFNVIRRLQKENKTIIYISHFLDEIKQVCDKYLVLRDGRVSGSGNVIDVERSDLVNMIIGQKAVAIKKNDSSYISNESSLQVRHIRSGQLLQDVSFDLHKGEVLGLWGLMGSGRTELIRALFGLDRIDNGEVYFNIDGSLKKIHRKNLFKYCGYVTEGRHDDGLFLSREVWINVTTTNLQKYQSNFLRIMKKEQERRDTERFIEQLSIKVPNCNTPAKQLSGGNQQKIVFAKWLNKELPVLILDEPTRGVDVGSKLEIHNLIRQMASKGKSVLLVTSEVDEMTDLTDRVIVLRNGKIVSEVIGEDINRANLMHLSLEG
ncbi:MAG: sugar ABC transporter ATP-binding protein, partial [Tannerellaceae bacterium]|nr:sugar ABC transporter ATP-binding protein [Tannerellaceae bacterium]